MAEAAAPTEPPAPALTADLWCLIHSKCDYQEILNSMLVCKMFRDELPKLVKSISTDQAIAQGTLDYISRTFTALEELELRPEYADGLPRLDFSRLRFPELTHLTVSCSPLATCRFTTRNTPKLQWLTLEQQNGCMRAFELELPELEAVHFEFVTVDDCSRLGTSLSACPKLRQFVSYKFWGPDAVYLLRLPSCESLSFSRSDSLEGLRIWAPKLESLDLQGCFSLSTVQLLDDPQPPQPPASAAAAAAAADAPAAAPAAARGDGGAGGGGVGVPKLRVNLVNTNASQQTMQHLRGHPRVDRRRVFGPNDNAERAWEAVAFGDALGGDGGSGSGSGDDGESGDDEDDSEFDDDEDEDGGVGMGMGGGFGAFLHAIGGGGGGVPLFGMPGGFPMPMGGFGGFGAYGGHGGGSDDGEGEEDDEDEEDGEGSSGGEGEDEDEYGAAAGDLMDALRQGGPEAQMLMMMLLQQMGGGGGMMGPGGMMGGGGGGGFMGGGGGGMPHGVVIEEASDSGDEKGGEEGGEEGDGAEGTEGGEGGKE